MSVLDRVTAKTTLGALKGLRILGKGKVKDKFVKMLCFSLPLQESDRKKLMDWVERSKN